MDNIVDILVRMNLRQSDQVAQGKIATGKMAQGKIKGNITQGENAQAEDCPMAEDGPVAEDRFLIDEGLDLLAAYRAIEDDGVRQAIRTLVEALAKADQGGEAIS